MGTIAMENKSSNAGNYKILELANKMNINVLPHVENGNLHLDVLLEILHPELFNQINSIITEK